jgi:hypothetical protein
MPATSSLDLDRDPRSIVGTREFDAIGSSRNMVPTKVWHRRWHGSRTTWRRKLSSKLFFACGLSKEGMAVRPRNNEGDGAMLELLLYCHMIANTKYAGHFAAVTAFIATVKAQCDRLLAPVVPGRKQPAPVFEGWTEQELARLLARLDAYVTSMV